MHIDLGELLRANGFSDTPQNRETMLRAAGEMTGVPEVVITDAERPNGDEPLNLFPDLSAGADAPGHGD